MTLLETFISAIATLRSHKSRSLLTMLGIVIGVFSVVTLVALVQGVKNFVTDQFNSIGSNLILVAPGRFSFGSDPAIAFSNNKLEEKDADLLNKQARDFIVAATPNIRLSKTAHYKEHSYLANLVGANEKFLEITNFTIDKGRSFSKSEVNSGAKVVIIGPQVVKNLFDSVNPLGKTIKIADVSFEVIGVTNSKGLNADERIVTPYTTLQKSLNVKNLSGISIKAKDGVNIDKAMREVRSILLQNHKKDEFSVLSQKDILNSFQNILGTLSIGLGAIAGISLLVGGIGIMNIMLVSVTERITEIGLRKAIGATSQNIATQFLVESSVLSILGGIIGILFGLLAITLAKPYLRAEIPLWAIMVSFGFSLFVGIVFGTYPAITASKKDPVEALRYEV